MSDTFAIAIMQKIYDQDELIEQQRRTIAELVLNLRLANKTIAATAAIVETRDAQIALLQHQLAQAKESR